MKFWLLLIIFVFSFFTESAISSTSVVGSSCLIANMNSNYSRNDEVYKKFSNERFIFFYGEIVSKDRKYIVTEHNRREQKIVQDKLTYKVTDVLKGVKKQTFFDVWHNVHVLSFDDEINYVYPQGDALVKVRYNEQGLPQLMLGDFRTGDCIDRKPISDEEFIHAYNKQRILHFTLLGLCFVLIGFITYPVFRFLEKRKNNGRAG